MFSSTDNSWKTEFILMNLDHFNDEDLIYKLIFADVLDVYQRKNNPNPYDAW